MKPILLAGTIIVNAALISYSIGIISKSRSKVVSRKVIGFLTIGVVADITATICMIIGSSNSPFSLHGLLGYSSLTAMLIETALSWRHQLRLGETPVSIGQVRYSLLAYLWWVAAYITGAVLVAIR